MPKYLYFQDGHVSGNNPISRKGDFFADWLVKFDELLSIAKKNKVEAIIDGGDILHSPNPSYKILDEIADRVEKVGIPIYSLFGNHASLYHSLEHSAYTGLAHLQKRSKLFQYLQNINESSLKLNPFHIKVIEYSHNIEEELKSNGIIFLADDKKDKESWKIGIVHAFVTPKPFLPTVMHVVCDDIKTNANLVLVAHYHAVWEKDVGNTKFLDIGCFGRRSISEHVINPACILLDTEKRTHKIIYLQKAKPGVEVFDLETKEKIVDFENQIDLFIADLKDISVQSMDIKGIIEYVGNENKVERPIIDILIDKCKKLEKENV